MGFGISDQKNIVAHGTSIRNQETPPNKIVFYFLLSYGHPAFATRAGLEKLGIRSQYDLESKRSIAKCPPGIEDD